MHVYFANFFYKELILRYCFTDAQILLWVNDCGMSNYGAECNITCFTMVAKEKEIYFKGKKVVADNNYALTKLLKNLQLQLRIKRVTMGTVGEYTCQAPGETAAKKIVNMAGMY